MTKITYEDAKFWNVKARRLVNGYRCFGGS